jgi:hypothetical protein
MRQPSTWLLSLAVGLLATFVLQSDPASFGPFVDLVGVAGAASVAAEG